MDIVSTGWWEYYLIRSLMVSAGRHPDLASWTGEAIRLFAEIAGLKPSGMEVIHEAYRMLQGLGCLRALRGWPGCPN